MRISLRSIPCLRLVILWAVAAVTLPVAHAEIAWHGDLPAALTASAASGRPVLAIFEARWADTSSVSVADVLASPEVTAVVSTCFEPVRLDVDAHPTEARDFGIDRVPAACVLDAQRQPLTVFECPTTAAEFVATAARAAQVAAAADHPPAGVAATPRRTMEETLRAPGPKRSADATVAAVSEKVRRLTDFAESEEAGNGDANHYAAGDRSRFTIPPSAPTVTTYQEPPTTPMLDRAPPQWVAEAPSATAAPAIVAAQPPAGDRPGIEPQPAAAGSWLETNRPTPSADATAAVTAPPAEAAPQAKPNGFLAALQKPWSIFSGGSSKPTIEPPAQPPKMPPALPQWRAALAGTTPAVELDRYGPMPLGLEGYCPVTVVERGTWVEGRPQWGVRHRGRTYLFAGPDQQHAFLADPDRYAPALSGDDPVLAFESGRSEPGRRAFGVTYQSRTYLFSSPETRAAFTADPDRFTTRVLIAEGLKPADGVRRF